MIRTFFAFDLDDAFLRDAGALSERLRHERALERARWVAPTVMHLTLRFLGETDPSLLPELASVVETLGRARCAVAVRATSFVAFSEPRRARILSLAIDDGGVLSSIVAEVEQAILALGFAPERRAYRPHLTIARLREPSDLRRLIADQPVAIAGRVTSIALYKSELGSAGPTYTALARAELGTEASSPPRDEEA